MNEEGCIRMSWLCKREVTGDHEVSLQSCADSSQGAKAGEMRKCQPGGDSGLDKFGCEGDREKELWLERVSGGV